MDDLRVGDADRDQVAADLHEHFAQGRLTQTELEERLDTVLSARTVGDLRQVTRDLPQSYSVDVAPERAARRRHRPPLPLILVGLLILSAFMAGPWWAMFVVIRMFALIFVITALMGFRRRRSGRRGSDRKSGWGWEPALRGRIHPGAPGARAHWGGPGGNRWGGPGFRGWAGPNGPGHWGPGTDRY